MSNFSHDVILPPRMSSPVAAFDYRGYVTTVYGNNIYSSFGGQENIHLSSIMLKLKGFLKKNNISSVP